MSEVDTTKPEAKEPETVLCPCCGKSTLHKPVKPNAELLDHYMACIMTGTPFSREYSAYQERVTLKVCILDAELRDKLNTFYGLLNNCAIVLGEDDALANKISACSENLRTVLHLESVSLKETADSENAVVFTPKKLALELLDKYSNQLSDALKTVVPETAKETLASILDSLYKEVTSRQIMTPLPPQLFILSINAHLQIYEMLIGAGFDENFWNGIELA